MLFGLASAVLWSAAGTALIRSSWLEGARLFWLDQIFDLRQRMGAAPMPDGRVVIVGIDERTRSELRNRAPAGVEDRWIIRSAIGRLLVALQAAKARVVGVDYFLDVPLGQKVDADLEDALAGDTDQTSAVLACFVTLTEEKRPLDRFAQYAGEGNVIIQADADGKFRRLRPELVVKDGTIPIFSFELARVFVAGPEAAWALEAPWRWNADGSLAAAGLAPVPPEMLLDFAGPAQSFEVAGQQFSALDVLDGAVPSESLRGKLVLVGPTARNADRFTVGISPASADRAYRRFFDRKYGLGPGGESNGPRVDLLRSGAMSGIEIHANAVGQILQGRYLREVSRQVPWLGSLVLTAVVAGLGWLFWQDSSRGKRRVVRGMIGRGVLFLGVFFGAAGTSLLLFSAFRWVWIPLELMAAWAGQAACGAAFTGMRLHRQNQKIEQMFGSAVGQELLEYINAHPEIMTANHRRVATVLFCDIRGFTALTERLDSDQVVDLLRRHFQTLWEPLAATGAWVDKYVGDMVMAAWNVLQPMADHPLRAVRAAVGMKLALARLNEDRLAQGLEAIEVGIGLHTGELVGGNVGSSKRSNFTIIGDTVNLASRIESESRCGEILISEDAYRLVRPHVIAQPLPPAAIRGKTGTYTLYEVHGLVGGPMVPGKDRPGEQPAC